MRILVTGSSGHLGEALMRSLPQAGHDPVGVDLRSSAFTDHVGSIEDREFVRACLTGIDAVIHSAALHKPHIATHTRQQFVDTNVTGTLNLLEEASTADVRAFVFTSTTSVFGRALTPASNEPAAWITEAVVPVPKNIYGVTKLAAEHLCELASRTDHLPCIILRTSRFFPEEDDRRSIREAYADSNAKVNELLYRRADLEDIVGAHVAACDSAGAIGFGCYLVSATTPLSRDDATRLRADAPAVVRRRVPEYEDIYARLGWTMFPVIDRVYVNERARHDLGWRPRHDFGTAIARLSAGEDHRSALAIAVGSKGYHDEVFADGPYPV